eukprot:6193271-Pleurochrysis_carterae.AAC.6
MKQTRPPANAVPRGLSTNTWLGQAVQLQMNGYFANRSCRQQAWKSSQQCSFRSKASPVKHARVNL